VTIGDSLRLRASKDLLKLLPPALPRQFHTGHLAEHLAINRTAAQRVAYCLREMKAVEMIGKQRNALLYRLPARRARKSKAA
jgi:hypothetical protein